jgi:hypothetical protein
MRSPRSSARMDSGSGNDERQYERACLQEVRQSFAGTARATPQYEVERVELRGEYPETAIRVEWYDRRQLRRFADEWPVWPLAEGEGQVRAPASFVANVIWANVDAHRFCYGRGDWAAGFADPCSGFCGSTEIRVAFVSLATAQ